LCICAGRKWLWRRFTLSDAVRGGETLSWTAARALAIDLEIQNPFAFLSGPEKFLTTWFGLLGRIAFAWSPLESRGAMASRSSEQGFKQLEAFNTQIWK
jgi:hypothetical protein